MAPEDAGNRKPWMEPFCKSAGKKGCCLLPSRKQEFLPEWEKEAWQAVVCRVSIYIQRYP